jgi:hypothetical protein
MVVVRRRWFDPRGYHYRLWNGPVGEGEGGLGGESRKISVRVAAAVMKTAAAEGRLNNLECQAALEQGEKELEDYISEHMYHPMYKALIRLPTGVLE